MVRQYQILLDPDKLAAYGIPHTKGRGDPEVQPGGRRLGARTRRGRVRGTVPRAICKSLDDFRQVPLVTTAAGVSVRLGDVARIQVGPEMRRGIGELDGEGEGDRAA